MVDSKTVLSQVQELQVVVHDIHAEGMTLSETFKLLLSLKNCHHPGGISKIISNTRERSCHLKT